MKLVERAKNILLQPQGEWAVIEQEEPDAKALYTGYIAILALIPAVADPRQCDRWENCRDGPRS